MAQITGRPKVGLALRGASSRSIFYIGFLEGLDHHKIPIDYIAAMSGSTIVAAAYACGTLSELKQQALSMNKEFFYSLIEKSKDKTGIYNLDKVEEMLRLYTHNKRFEDVKPLMGFVAADINKGDQVVLSMGDIAHAARVSCTLPGIFTPTSWGNRTLVDGGVMSIVPGDVVRAAGLDIVIGVDLRTSKYIFGRAQIALKRVFNFLKEALFLNDAEKLWNRFERYVMSRDFFGQYPYLEELSQAPDYPGKFAVLGRTMDLALEAERRNRGKINFDCDLLIRPDIPVFSKWRRYLFLDLIDFTNNRELYEIGRQTAEEFAPKIWQMMSDLQSRKQRVEVSFDELIKNNF